MAEYNLLHCYSATRSTIDDVEIIRLSNLTDDVSVSIAPQVGNNAFEFLVGGKNYFWFPHSSIGEFAENPQLCGNPLLTPWANRLDQHAFYANGTQYKLNPELHNYLTDPLDQPIHGLLLYSSWWEVTQLDAQEGLASVTSCLDFSSHQSLMEQFPFPHRLEMRYVLRNDTLKVQLGIENTGTDPMPVSVGFHPYFQLHDCPRDEWVVHIAADSVWNLNENLIPTGSKSSVQEVFPNSRKMVLKGHSLDHVFGDLHGDEFTQFRVQGKKEQLVVTYGKKFPVAVIYAPDGPGQSFICFEPMSGITNAFNLAHQNIYNGLMSIQPGETWKEDYMITVRQSEPRQ